MSGRSVELEATEPRLIAIDLRRVEVQEPEIAVELARLTTLEIAAAMVRTRRQAADLAIRDRQQAAIVALLHAAAASTTERAA